MSVFQNMNQFAQTPIKGAIAGDVSPSTVSCELIGTSVATLVPGDYVKLVAGTGTTILVEKCGLTDNPFGAVVFNPKKDKFVAHDTFEVVLAFGIMFMEAGAAITRGAQLQFTPTGTLVITNAGNPVCGLALDSAASSGDIIRVLIIDPITLAATITSGSINGVAIGGSTPAAGTFTTLAYTGVASGSGGGFVVLSKRVRSTIAAVNSGVTLLAAVAGLKYRLVSVKIIAIGGAVTSTTAAGTKLVGTQGASPVSLLVTTKAALTQSAVNTVTSTGATVLADGASFVDNDVNTAITFAANGGSDLAGASNIDVEIEYTIES